MVRYINAHMCINAHKCISAAALASCSCAAMSDIVGSAVLLVGLATVASTFRISSASPAEAMLRTS